MEIRKREPDWLNIHAFSMGVFVTVALYAGALRMGLLASSNTATVPRAMFIGAANGHYLGRSFKQGESTLASGYLGAFSVASIAILYASFISTTGFNPNFLLAVTLVGMFFGLFQAHYSGFVEDHSQLEKMLESFSDISPLVFAVIVLSEQLLPMMSGISAPNIDTLKEVALGVSLLFNLFFYFIVREARTDSDL